MRASTKPTAKKKKQTHQKSGKGLLNHLINKLPVELHIPGYQYCGPGTKLKKRLARNDPGVNELDRACQEHDIAYGIANSVSDRNKADKNLAKSAWKRVKSSDANFGERMAALGVAGIMKVKSKAGMGVSKKAQKRKQLKVKKNVKARKQKPNVNRIFQKAKKAAKEAIRKKGSQTLPIAAKIATIAAKAAIKGEKPSKQMITNGLPRIIPVPKIGGVLPLIPIFAGLSALGALMGGSASVANAVLSTKNAKKALNEGQRHNETMEAISLGRDIKTGSGFYLKPHKSGFGLYLNPHPKN